jgi:hypothetical protein
MWRVSSSGPWSTCGHRRQPRPCHRDEAVSLCLEASLRQSGQDVKDVKQRAMVYMRAQETA